MASEVKLNSITRGFSWLEMGEHDRNTNKNHNPTIVSLFNSMEINFSNNMLAYGQPTEPRLLQPGTKYFNPKTRVIIFYTAFTFYFKSGKLEILGPFIS